jgi:hypothetical protein
MHLALSIAILCGLAHQGESTWRYVVPPDGDAQRAPAPSSLWLFPAVPDGLEVHVEPRAKQFLFAQVRYGDTGSPRIAIALDRPAGKKPLLYVDADRNRMLDESDLVAGDGPAWELSMSTFTHEDGANALVPRRVFIRLTGLDDLITYGTLGWLEGRVAIGDRSCVARRMDADGNGFFTDPDDRVWLDLDGDGAWAPFEERFAYAPLLVLSGARYALRSDRVGRDLTVEKIEGVGSIRLRLPLGADGKPRNDVLALQALLVGKDGSAVGVQGYDAPVEVPVGQYRIGMLTIEFADKGKGDPWTFVFSEPGGSRELQWYSVARDAEVVIDPAGKVRFDVGADTSRAHAPGDKVAARLALYTGDGLLINTCYRGATARGWVSSGPSGRVRMLAAGGRLLEEASTGFA